MMAEKRAVKYFNQPLRMYNLRVFSRSRMTKYTKKYIDGVYSDVTFNKCFVVVEKITDEDIANYRLSLVGNKGNTTHEEDKNTCKDNNTAKDDITSKIDTNSNGDITSKSDTTCKDDKTSKNDTTSKGDKTSKSDKTSKFNKISKGDTISKGNKPSKGNTKKTKGGKKSKVVKTSKDKNTVDEEPVKKKQKLDVSGVDVLKLVLSREGETDKFKSQFKSSLKPNREIASTSTEEIPIVVDCEESTEPANSTAKNINPMISIVDPINMMDEDNYLRWMNIISFDTKPKQTNGMKNLAVAQPSTSGSMSSSSHTTKGNGMKHPLNSKNHVKENLKEIEKLYRKYFSKSVQDTIVIIANILNIISMSNKHHKARMDESFKKRSEAEKLKERCDANRLHGRHKKILETKLKNNFINVVSSFDEIEFDTAFQMFFLSILTVLRVLDQPKFRKGSIFKNLVLLLWNSLKNSEFNHPKIFAMFRSKTFRPDCIDIISLIEDSRDTDPGVTDRMSLFFVSTVNGREYFQAVIDAVTSDSNEDLSLLIDNATFQCCINSKFKDPIDTSIVQHSNVIPATQSNINSSGGTVQHWFLAKNPDGTYQQIPVVNGIKPQIISNTTVEPSIVTSQPINNFYESFSSSLQKRTSEPSTSKVIPTKKCFVVTSTISNSSMVQVMPSSSGTATPAPAPPTTTTYVTFKPPIQNRNSTLHRAEGSTILLGNKQYQLVKSPMSTVVNGTNIAVRSQPSNIKCYAINCNSPATIMCSSCTTVKYCTHSCQRRDWYDSHINDCERMLNNRLTRP